MSGLKPTAMLNKLIIAFVFLGNTMLLGQTSGSLKGKIADKENGEGVAFANILIEDSGTKVSSAVADVNGEFTITQIPFGRYDLKIKAVGYQTFVEKGLGISSDTVLLNEIKLVPASVAQECIIVSYCVPLIDANTKSGCTVTRQEYQAMPSKNVNSVAQTTSGVSRRGFLKIRGSRSESTAYYIDGQRVYGQYGTANSEEYSKIIENIFCKTTKDPLSTFSIDVDKASYSNVRRFVNDGQLPPKDAVRIEEMINYFSYDLPEPSGQDPFSINTEASVCPWNKNHQLIHIGLQGKKIETGSLPPNNLVFLIDVSGSMDSYDKLPLVKSSLRMLVEQLRKQDRVSIVVYAGAAGLVLPSTHGDEKEEIIDAIDKLSAGGSTAGGEGILLAYKLAKENFISDGNNRVVLATDGDFNVGVSSDSELSRLIESKRNDGIFLTVLGFGTGNYKDSKMEQLADKGNGNYAYVDNLLEAKKVLVKEMGGTLMAIAKDVKIQVEFNPRWVKGYRLIGYENRILAAEDFNNDKKDAGEIGSGHTVTALYEIIPSSSDEMVDSIDALKYQKTDTVSSAFGEEMMTIKFRYKEPKGTKSKLLVKTLDCRITPFEVASENLRFAASVAEFGLLLRDSEYKGNSGFEDCILLAKASRGKDEEGYRAEFIRLVESSELLWKAAGRSSQK